MGHTQHDLLRTVFSRTLDQLIQSRNQALTALQTETLSAWVLGVKMLFKAFCCCQTLKQVPFNFVFKGRIAVIALDSLLDPLLFLKIDDMHELIAN